MKELKTSDEWQKLCNVTVLDPDGWDRRNFTYSWARERITRDEFENRLIKSTCSYTAYTRKKYMWKDIMDDETETTDITNELKMNEQTKLTCGIGDKFATYIRRVPNGLIYTSVTRRNDANITSVFVPDKVIK